ncbi:RHS repeat-associated core domain-containing protein [Microbacterium sp.]|uniref:RHS repeat-associated core domain-containing protein n=1 Tax=Microbacterium sp. TaxID=51671 RepID=UPI0039E57E02
MTTRPRSRRTRPLLAALLAVILAIDPFGIAAVGAQAARPDDARFDESRDENFDAAVDRLTAEPVFDAADLSAPGWEVASSGSLRVASADVPAPSEATVELSGDEPAVADLDGMRVEIAAVDGEAAPQQVQVGVADAKTTKDAGVTGVVLDLQAAVDDAETVDDAEKTVRVTVSYASFAGLVNADWASRLQLVQLPDCDAGPDCRPIVLGSTNDPIAQTVTADVPLAARQDEGAQPGEQAPAQPKASAATGTSSTSAPAAMAATTLALTAGANPSGAGGSWTATNLSPSSTWGTSGNSGAFTWSYPLQTPGVSVGPVPDLSLGYSSAVSDGRTPSSNNQSGWIGEGFDLTSGFIERTYTPCQNDTGAGANNIGLSTGDLCWGKDAMTLTFKGSSTTLIKDATSGKWYAKSDDGTRVERLTGGWSGGTDGEYWKLTTTDGVQYFFGRGKRSASDPTALKSAWTVPVYGNHAGEACYQTPANGGFSASRCTQVWRWNLDYVVDTSGNTMTYVYETETNNYVPDYGQNATGTAIPYVSGGRLARIDYGTHTSGSLSTPAPVQVVFASAPRCLTDPANGLSLCTTATTSPSTKTWPDTPKDLQCAATTGCLNVTPVFFDTTYLQSVTTQVHDGTTYRKVDRWDLGYRFTGEGDGGSVQYATNPILRLETVTRTGLGGTDATTDDITLPPIRFGYQFLQGRVDAPNDGVAPLWRPRVIQVITDVGANISVAYRTECSPTDLPGSSDAAQQANTRLCYPVKWAPPGEGVRLDWFHKYVVESLREDGAAPVSPGSPELVTGSVGRVTTYEYTKPGWAKPTGALVDPATVTYSEFRGAQTVVTTVGDGPSAMKTSTVYFRGLGGAMPAAGPAGAQVNATDTEQFAGRVFASTTLNGTTPVATTVTVPGAPVTVATNAAGLKSTRSPSATVTGFSFRANGALDKQTKTVTTLNAASQVVSIEDLGDVAIAADDVCTKIEYATDAAFIAANMLAFPTKTEKFAALCATTPTTAQLISRDLTTFDSAGRVLTTSALKPDGSGTFQTSAVLSYDARGRVLQTSDALGNVTTTGYTTGAGGQVTAIAQTTPDPDGTGPLTGFMTTNTYDPVTGWLLKTTDQNGKKTTATYDALGRVLTVRYPQHQSTSAPSLAYQYVTQANGLNAVVTRKIAADGVGQYVSVELMDGLLRTFQTQTEGLDAGPDNIATAAERGRVVTHTFYDSAGRVVVKTGQWHATGAPSSTPIVAEPSPPSQTTYQYDGAGRVVQETLWNGTYSNPAYEVWRTVTTYDGSTTLTIPPVGGVPTEQIVDARGQLVQLKEHARNPVTQAGVTSPAAVLALPATTTTYEYNAAGQLTKMTDPGSRVWTYAYDKTGRQVQAVDPDSGTTTTTYTKLGQVETRTNGNGQTLAYTYDPLGRSLTVRDGSITGTVRIQWSYDQATDAAGNALRGPMSAATRKTANGDLVRTVTKYDDAGNALQVDTKLPNDTANLKSLAGKTFTTKYGFTAGGWPSQVTYPAVANAAGTTVLGTELVSTKYDSAGMPSSMNGPLGWGLYVARSDYDAYGQQWALDLGNTKGAVITFAWDPVTHRLNGMSLDREDISGSEIALSYGYDPGGNVTSVADAPTNTAVSAQAERQCFVYDGMRRLTDAWSTTAAACQAAGSVTQSVVTGPAPYWQQFSYDTVGNRTQKVVRAAAGATTTAYTVAAGSHRVSQVKVTPPSGSATTTSVTWDAAGNQTTFIGGASTGTLSWDAEGELVASTGPGAGSNVFDAAGDRVIRTDSAGATVFLPGGMEVKVTSAGAVSASRWYSFAGRTVAVRTGTGMAGVSSVVCDPQGSPVGWVPNTNWAAGVTRVRNDPFGAPRSTGGTVQGHGFLGASVDGSTLTALGARFYDAASGRFVSVDPLLDRLNTAQFNAYGYADNNPVTFSDPSGLMPGINKLPDGGRFRHPGMTISAPASAGKTVPTPKSGPPVVPVSTVPVIGVGGGTAAYWTSSIPAYASGGGGWSAPPLTGEQWAGIGIGVLSVALIVAGVACIVATVGICAAGISVGGGFAFAGGAAVATAEVTVSAGAIIGTSAVAGGAAAATAGAGMLFNESAQSPHGIKAGSRGGPSAGRNFPRSVKNEVIEDNPSTCVYCRMETDSPQIDHVIPRSRGGNATFENAQTACPWCNASKGARDYPVNQPPGYRGVWPPEWWR